MPLILKFDARHKLLIATVTELASESYLDEALHLIVSSVIWAPDVDILWDLRMQDFSRIDRTLSAALVKVRERYPQRGFCHAATLVSDDTSCRLMRMHEHMSSDLSPKIRVFRDYDSAWQWLLAGQARPRHGHPIEGQAAADSTLLLK